MFFGKGHCATCHPAPYYTDNLMHNLQAERFFKPQMVNGRMASADGPIKTFPLRGIKDSPPYLHDGRLLTLEDTVEFFNLVLETKLTDAGEERPGGVHAVPVIGVGSLFWNHLAAGEVVERLPRADEVRLAVFDQHFGHERLRVVVVGHHVAVGAGVADDEVVADLGLGQRAVGDEAAFVLGEDVARFAQRAADDDVARGSGSGTPPARLSAGQIAIG